MQALYDALLVTRKEEDNALLQLQLQDIFNYQNNIIVMIKNKVPILVNHRFLDFFKVESIEDYLENNLCKNHCFDSLLLEHSDFLYSTQERTWLDEACANPGKLFHAKIMNHEGENRHLILKTRKIPNKDDYYVLSFDDVTELNLMGLFDKDAAVRDIVEQDKTSIIKMIKIIQDNSAEIKVHNFYRGLTITNSAVVIKNDDEGMTIKTTYSQLKIMQLVKNTVMTSEIFPKPVAIKAIDKVDFDQQTISFSKMQFLARSAAERKYIRLEPEDNHKVSLFFKDKKFTAECTIVDISIVSAKISVSALPPGIEKDIELQLSIILPTEAIPLVINTSSTLYRIDKLAKSYDLVVLFELHNKTLENLITYMSKRQMALIREFKSLELKL